MHKTKMYFAKEADAVNKQDKISSYQIHNIYQVLYHAFTLLLSIKLQS